MHVAFFSRRNGFGRPVHEMDEDLFESGIDLAPLVFLSSKRRDRVFQGASIVTAHMERAPEWHRLLHSRLLLESLGEFEQIGAGDRPRGQMRLRDYLFDRSLGEQVTVHDVGKSM